MKRITLLFIAVSLFMISPVMAYDGRTLVRYCEIALLSEKNRFSSVHLLEDFNTCVSSVNTIFRAISELERFVNLEQPNVFSCVPDEIELLEKIRVVHTYIKEHPEKVNNDSVTLILEAIVEAFPCTESQTPR